MAAQALQCGRAYAAVYPRLRSAARRAAVERLLPALVRAASGHYAPAGDIAEIEALAASIRPA